MLYHYDRADGINCGPRTLGESQDADLGRAPQSRQAPLRHVTRGAGTRSGVEQESLERVECGKRHYLRSDHLGRIAEALDVPADELLGIRDFKGV